MGVQDSLKSGMGVQDSLRSLEWGCRMPYDS